MATSQPTTPLKPPIFSFEEVCTGASKRGLTQAAYTHPNTKKIPSSLAPASLQPYFTTAATEGAYTATDMAWTVRTAFEILPGMNQPSAVIADQTLGGLSMMNTTAGAIGLYQSTQAFNRARAIDDADGAIIAGIGMASSTVQTGFGTAIAGSRATSIAAVLAPTKTGLATTAAFFGYLSNILIVPLFAFMVGWGAFQSHRAKKFYENWASQNRTFEALVASVYVSKERIDQMIAEDHISLRFSGLTALKKALGDDKSETRCIRYRYASSKTKRELLERVLQKHFSKDYPELLKMKEYYFSQLDQGTFGDLDLPAAIGLLLSLRKLQLKNQATVQRALGADQLEKIQRAAKRGLAARLDFTEAVVKQAADREWTVLKAGIEASYAKTQFLYKSTALLGLFGTIVGILTFVLTGPFGPAVVLALTLVCALAFVLHDAYTHEPSGQPGRFDKIYLGVGIALIAFSILATVGSFLFFGGSVPILALSLALALVLLGILIHNLLALKQQEKSWNATHTGVHDLITHLKYKKGVDSKARRLFKQLPKDLRKGITDVAAKSRPKELRYTTMSPKDKEKFHRAVKNSAGFFWKQWWYSNRNDYFKQQAILLDQLALSIQQNMDKNEMAPTKHAFKQIRDPNTKNVLFEQAHRVFAREESARSLRTAAKRFTAA